MKKIVHLLFLSLVSWSVFGQITDNTLEIQSNQIKNETTPGANTANRVGTLFHNLSTSKVNIIYGVTAGGMDTYTATVSSSVVSYVTGQHFLILFTNGNSGAATINLNSLGAKSLVKNGGDALEADDIKDNTFHWLAYDGTNMQVLDIGASGGGGGGWATSGTTTLTGNTTISGDNTRTLTFSDLTGLTIGMQGEANITVDGNTVWSSGSFHFKDAAGYTFDMGTPTDIVFSNNAGVNEVYFPNIDYDDSQANILYYNETTGKATYGAAPEGSGGGAAKMLGEKVITASTYTAVAADTAYWVFFENACTVTIPDDLPENFTATYQRLSGGGDVEFQSDGTSVLESVGVDLTLKVDGAAVTIRKYNEATYYLHGALGDALEDTDDLPEGSTNLYFTNARAQSAAVANSITNGVTTSAPNQDQVFDALAGKEPTLTSTSASTAGGTITLDMNSLTQRMFVGSASFATSKTLALSNATNALVFNFHFEITDVAATLVCPSSFLMGGPQWNTSTDTWTPPATGKYEMGGSYDGTNWKVKIVGPFE
jgi:hypothetical protein